MIDKIELDEEAYGKVSYNEPLKNHSSWRIGGFAKVFIRPKSEEHIRNVLALSYEHDMALATIGNGTNILFDDLGFDGIIMKISNNYSNYFIDDSQIICQAGIRANFLSKVALKSDLSGLEHIVGIPGTMGGLVCMNGGSQGKSIGNNVVEVKAIDTYGNCLSFDNEKCKFSYRYSLFQDNKYIITTVKFQLDTISSSTEADIMHKILEGRKKRFPLDQPNCGSVFKSVTKPNGEILPAGLIIEEMNLKGFSIGGAEVSRKHGNFIVNIGNASSADVISLISKIRTMAYNEKGLLLEPEIKYLSPVGFVTL